MTRRRLLICAVGLSLWLCLFCAYVSFANERVFAEGAVAAIDGKEKIVHEPERRWYARAYGAAAITFAVPPVIWIVRGGRVVSHPSRRVR